MSHSTISSQLQSKPVLHEAPIHQSFIDRSMNVDQLIDTKCRFVTRSGRLRAYADSHPEQRTRCLALIVIMEGRIARLQEQIDRELKGLMYSLHKAPAPSPFTDYLPG